MSITSSKEKRLLAGLARSLGQPVDPILEKEVSRFAAIKASVVESIRENLADDIMEVSKKTALLDERKPIPEQPPEKFPEVIAPVTPNVPAQNIIQEEPEEKPPLPQTLVEKAASQIKKEIGEKPISPTPFSPPNAPLVSPDVKAIQDKLKFLEQWVSKISMAGPGGGAHSILTLEMPTKLVTGDYYLSRHDYYVGVNCTTKANIHLPTTSIDNGREFVIKDESGKAQLIPIKIVGTVDNDINGFEIRINNGAVHLIYRNGWRIY